MTESGAELQPLLRPEDVEATLVYPIIHMIRSDVVHFIDTPLTFQALTAPDLTYTLVRPLSHKYLALQRDGNMSVVFCLLLNRVHFDRDDNMATAPISRTRAILCEILAIRLFRQYGNSLLHLTLALTTTWPVYNGADPDLVAQAREERDDDLEDRVGNAIEMAILGKAKLFIKSSACQKVIDGIWSGQCVYQAESSHSILSDTYKRTPVHFYDPHRAPLLDHYRLKVPAIRSVLEYVNFLLLFILFVFAIELSEIDRLNIAEVLFMIYALGFTLEKVAAMQEHGIRVYFKGTWNGFDLAFVTFFCIYAFLRIYGIYHDSLAARTLGIDFQALIACLLFPRLAFVTLKNNLMVLSLRAMIMQFVFLMLVAAFCFCGFLYALWTLSRNQAGYSVGTISWWMLDLYFGLDASGFDRATQFHPIFGPLLMVTYACLSNTLLVTVLVAILTNTFATINEDAAAEAMFRKAVSTIEGVKADSLFSYQPPVNLVALCIMLPASYILSPRWFHKVNVFMIRITSFPVLLVIAAYERQSKKAGSTSFYDTMSYVMEKIFDSLPRSLKRLTFFEGLAGSEADIDAIFELEGESESALDTRDDVSTLDPRRRRLSGSSYMRPQQPAFQRGVSPSRPSGPRGRLTSIISRGLDTAQQFASPLAQVFQPLIVDDDIPEEPNGGFPSSPPGVSYGPASRRRLMSIQSMGQRRPQDMGQGPNPANTVKRVPSSANGQGNANQPSDSGDPPVTAGEVKEMEEDGSDLPDLAKLTKRLEVIEKQQDKIEGLLMQLVKDLKANKHEDDNL